MKLDSDTCYRALESHDARFDGVFYVGVQTTGIYCRTVCPARTPRRDRCTFHLSAAAAERAGFRPCLRCRPELAPGNARIDAANRLAALAYSRIEDGALDGVEGGVASLAGELGVSERHLRRVVRDAFGVAPAALAQTQRLLLAKRLLTDTSLPITQVAFASGFGSLRRFNALFHDRYRLNPTDLRRNRGEGTAGATPGESFDCYLAYRPPLDWDALLRFLRDRAVVGVESVEGDVYRRTLRIGRAAGWLAVAPAGGGRSQLRVTVAASLAPALLPLLARVKRAFDLGADPETIATHLGGLAAARRGLRVPGAFDGFEIAVRAILGQQISVRAATTLACRFAHAFGEPVAMPFADLDRLTPTPERVASAAPETLTPLGIIGARARAIIGLARVVADGTVSLHPTADPEATIARLQTLPGIGAWTAHYIALRALNYPDAFPHTDLAVMKAIGESNPQRVLARAEAWRPWRAYAAMHLWQSLTVNEENKANPEEEPDRERRKQSKPGRGTRTMTAAVHYTYVESPIGSLLLTSDGTSLTGLYMNEHRHGPTVSTDWSRDDNAAPFADARAQLADYFAGRRVTFDLPLAPATGTPFQRVVWEQLRQIPFGETISYGELARRIGSPNASRAVGLANGRNPLSIVVPCHRVVGASGKLTGYAGGVEKKERLLAHEAGGKLPSS